MNELVFIENDRVVTDSLTVADVFEKNHDHVMRDIRNQISKLAEAGEGEWGVTKFEETHYQHPQNRQFYAKYLMTEDAFALVAMSYVTPKAMKMKVKFLDEFKRMKEHMQPKSIEDLIIMQAQSVKELKTQVTSLTEDVNTIRDTFIQRDDDWRKSVNNMLNKAAFKIGGQYSELRNESYKRLEERARCKLNTRLLNTKARLEERGATKTQINKTTKMDVIEEDARLKEIYHTIVKEMSIGALQHSG